MFAACFLATIFASTAPFSASPAPPHPPLPLSHPVSLLPHTHRVPQQLPRQLPRRPRRLLLLRLATARPLRPRRPRRSTGLTRPPTRPPSRWPRLQLPPPTGLPLPVQLLPLGVPRRLRLLLRRAGLRRRRPAPPLPEALRAPPRPRAAQLGKRLLLLLPRPQATALRQQQLPRRRGRPPRRHPLPLPVPLSSRGSLSAGPGARLPGSAAAAAAGACARASTSTPTTAALAGNRAATGPRRHLRRVVATAAAVVATAARLRPPLARPTVATTAAAAARAAGPTRSTRRAEERESVCGEREGVRFPKHARVCHQIRLASVFSSLCVFSILIFPCLCNKRNLSFCLREKGGGWCDEREAEEASSRRPCFTHFSWRVCPPCGSRPSPPARAPVSCVRLKQSPTTPCAPGARAFPHNHRGCRKPAADAFAPSRLSARRLAPRHPPLPLPLHPHTSTWTPPSPWPPPRTAPDPRPRCLSNAPPRRRQNCRPTEAAAPPAAVRQPAMKTGRACLGEWSCVGGQRGRERGGEGWRGLFFFFFSRTRLPHTPPTPSPPPAAFDVSRATCPGSRCRAWPSCW